MKMRFLLLFLALLPGFNAAAQTSPAAKTYRLEVNEQCKMEARVCRAATMRLTVNKRSFWGRLAPNNNQPNAYSYRVKNKFFCTVVFRKDATEETMTIANQDYLKVFFPCNDQKYLPWPFRILSVKHVLERVC